MTALGAVQIPLDDLDFPQPRQISFKERQRLVRAFQNLSKLGAAEIHLPCTVDEVKFNQILARLALSASQLFATLGKGQKKLPLLSGVRLSCLYGHYPAAAASRAHGTAVVVHLFSAELLNALRELITTFSYEPQQSDGELYQKIIESYRRDEVTFAVCMGFLTKPKERNMRMLLRPKNLPLVRSLNSLFEIPGLIEGLQLGNFHKWLALHLDEQIMAYFSHVHMVWKERICESRQAVMRDIGVDDVRMLQFRMPKVSSDDADTIGRLLDDGTLFPRIGDPGARAMLRRNLLALDVVIPSLETFQENMHYVAIAAKFLIQYVVGKVPLCKSRTKRSPTILELLSSSWTAPDVLQVEVADDKPETVEGRASPSFAFTQLILVCLRLFPWLQDAYAPREDWPEDNFKAGIHTPCITYVLHFAFLIGFRTPMTIEAQSWPGRYPGPARDARWDTMPDWRGGRPFTRTFWALRANAFLPRLHVAAKRRHHPNPEFVLLDMVTAFFGKQDFTLVDYPKPEDISFDEEDSVDEEDQEMGDAPADPEGQIRRQKAKSKARHSKHIRPAARGIANREAARSVMGTQIKHKRDKTDRQKPLPVIFPPQLLQVLKESGASGSETSQNLQLDSEPAIDFAPTAAPEAATFGREATRSVFAQIPKLTQPRRPPLPPPKSKLRKPPKPPLPPTESSLNPPPQPPLWPTDPLSGARELVRKDAENHPRTYNFSTPSSSVRQRAIAPIRRMMTREPWRTTATTIEAPRAAWPPTGPHRAGVHRLEENPTVQIRRDHANVVVAKRARRVGEFNPSSEDQPSSSAALPHSTMTTQPGIQPAAGILDISREVTQPLPVSSTPTTHPEKISTDDKGKQTTTDAPPGPVSQEAEAIFSAQSDYFPNNFAESRGGDPEFEDDEDDSPLPTPVDTGTDLPAHKGVEETNNRGSTPDSTASSVL